MSFGTLSDYNRAIGILEEDVKRENMKKEESMTFEVGDRIIIVGDRNNGCIGTITGYEKGFYAVEYDQAINGYRCCIQLAENMALLIEEEQKDIYKIADHYGEGIQLLKLIEECGELIVAVAKGEDKNIIEELADVSIMLEQVVYLMNCKKKFKMEKAMKINRQLGRMEGEE